MNVLLKNIVACGAMAAALAGCASARYVPAAGEQTAHVAMYPRGDAWLCVDGQRYGLLPAEGGARTALVPAGRRITLGTELSYQAGNAGASCRAAVSVVPAAGSTLALHRVASAGRCFLEAVREDAATDTGVAPDPTIGPPAC